MIRQAQKVISRERVWSNQSNMETKSEERNGMTPFLQMRGISKSYSGVKVLHQVNLSVTASGEIGLHSQHRGKADAGDCESAPCAGPRLDLGRTDRRFGWT